MFPETETKTHTRDNVNNYQQSLYSFNYYQGQTDWHQCYGYMHEYAQTRKPIFSTYSFIHSFRHEYMHHTHHSQRDSRLGLERLGVVSGHPGVLRSSLGTSLIAASLHCTHFISLHQSFIYHLQDFDFYWNPPNPPMGGLRVLMR